MRTLLTTMFTMASLATTVETQPYTVLHRFNLPSTAAPHVNSDGVSPQGVTVSSNTLFGTAGSGGNNGVGTVFKVNTDGTGFTVLKTFAHPEQSIANEGEQPNAGLQLSGTTLYGTTVAGGESGWGTVFKIHTDGSGFAILKHFILTEGTRPNGNLVLVGSTLYGTAASGGAHDQGSIFKINTNGTGFAVLHHFTDEPEPEGPNAGLVSASTTLYGTAPRTIFRIKPDGSGYSVLFRFPEWASVASLAISGTTLYGTTGSTVFKINTDGTGYTQLADLMSSDQPFVGDVVVSGSTLYGALRQAGKGTVFQLNTDGTEFSVLTTLADEFRDNAFTGLCAFGNVLYGTTSGGRSSGGGAIFKIDLPPAPPRASQPPATAAKSKTPPFTVLHHFATYEEGGTPGEIVSSGRTLYGTAAAGGMEHGTLFKVNTDGSGFSVLNYFTNLDGGGLPQGPIIISSNTLYGTVVDLSEDSYGAVYKVNTDGTSLTLLKRFTGGRLHSDGMSIVNQDGAGPQGLVLSGSTLYGTTGMGGESGRGTLFKMNVAGSGFTLLKQFPANDGPPNGDLLLSESTLYGTTAEGGESESGTVFKVSTDGEDYTVLKHFSGPDGAEPMSGLVLSGRTLYGTTRRGGTADGGTVFRINTDGTGFKVLKSFDWEGSDGAIPHAGLVLYDRKLYGTTSGADGRTVAFQLDTEGTGYKVLHKFAASDGESPDARLLFSGNTLYGTAKEGGLGNGVVFRIELTSPGR